MTCVQAEDRRMKLLRGKVRSLLINILLILACAAQAQVRVCDMLRSMPDSLVPYLSANNRLDMIDFKNANMKAEVRNSQEGRSELVTLTDRYADLALNPAHRMEMCLLDVTMPIDSCSHILCVVDTYGADIKESTVRFFSLTWRQLPADDYVMLPPVMFTATLHEQDFELVLTPSNDLDRPAMEEQKEIEIFPIKLNWKNNFFK